MPRVLLNIFSNGFYAATTRARSGADNDFKPILKVATRNAGDSGSPAPLDAAGWDAFMASFSAAFPDARIDIADAVGDAHRVASRWVLSGTHRGTFNGIGGCSSSIGRPSTC
jgi:predicted ester cyclase